MRKKLKRFSKFLAMPFVALKINPLIISFLGIPLALAAFYFVLLGQWFEAFAFAGLASGIDLIDGAIARELKKESLFGNYFETMIDKLVELILFAGFVFYFPLETVFALGFSLITSYAKPRVALVIITDNHDWPAMGEHAEKLLVLLAGILLTYFEIAVSGVSIMQIALWVIIAMTLVGLVQRISYGKKLIKEAEKKGNILPYLKSK